VGLSHHQNARVTLPDFRKQRLAAKFHHGPFGLIGWHGIAPAVISR
jgi:hypothetical protein